MAGKYECDECGACCRKLIVEIDLVDVLREPKLREVVTPFKSEAFFENEEDERLHGDDPFANGAALATCKPCPMLCGNKCTIYPTRPNVCVGFSAGSSQCQEARDREGLPPLLAT